MSKTELLKRYGLFVLSLFIIAFAVSFITKSLLGTSPISSIPYVLSLNSPLSMGLYFLFLNLLLIATQMVLLGGKGIKQRRIELLMQLPVSLVFSLFVDVTMLILSDYSPELYSIKILALILGCFILALGISLEVIAKVTMMSPEYTTQIIAQKYNKIFGNVKLVFDVLLVVTAAGVSLLFTSTVEGIREGTVIAALITGPFVRIVMGRLSFINKYLEPTQASPTTDSLVVTISREYGSGGHRVAEMVAKKLGIPLYDKELIELVAQESHLSESYVSEKEQNLPHPILYQMIMQDYEAPLEKSLSKQDALFVAQSSVIRRLASKGSCVIVGRCADYILRDFSGSINIFLYADMDYKERVAVSEYGLSPSDAHSEIQRIDRARADHYYHYTNRRWGASRNYHLSCNSGHFSVDELSDMIVRISRRKRSE
ncbi:MAG: cytidylate kinase family protein [Rikenellaceae bacterium]